MKGRFGGGRGGSPRGDRKGRGREGGATGGTKGGATKSAGVGGKFLEGLDSSCQRKTRVEPSEYGTQFTSWRNGIVGGLTYILATEPSFLKLVHLHNATNKSALNLKYPFVIL